VPFVDKVRFLLAKYKALSTELSVPIVAKDLLLCGEDLVLSSYETL
jgi:hypothetical protein